MNVKTMFYYSNMQIKNPDMFRVIGVLFGDGEMIVMDKPFKGPDQYFQILSTSQEAFELSNKYDWCYVMTIEQNTMKYRTMYGRPIHNLSI